MKFIKNSLTYMIVLSLIIWLLSSFIMFKIESGIPEATIQTFGDAMWWSIITLTNTAYGDRIPITVMGKVFAVMVILSGVGLFGTVISKIAVLLIDTDHEKYEQEIEEKIEDIQEDLEDIEEKIDKLIKNEIKDEKKGDLNETK